MLIAIDQNGNQIQATKSVDRTQNYFCPCCDTPVKTPNPVRINTTIE